LDLFSPHFTHICQGFLNFIYLFKEQSFYFGLLFHRFQPLFLLFLSC
jgi:hypothetical protein